MSASMTNYRKFLLAAGLLSMLSAASIAQDPAQAQLDIANGFFRRGFFEEAAAEYRAYIEGNPQAPQMDTALYRLGESEYAQRNYEDALTVYDQFSRRFRKERNPAARCCAREKFISISSNSTRQKRP